MRSEAWLLSTESIPELSLPGGLMMTGSSPRYSCDEEAIHIRVGGQDDVAQILWNIPQGHSLRMHGHCLGLYDAVFKKVAEATVTSAGPVVTSESPDGRQVSFTAQEAEQRINVLVKRRDFQIVERGQMPSTPEWVRWSEGERQLTYLLVAPKTLEGRSRMMVVFSAIGAEFDFTYNYRSALSAADAYKLYILDDFGKRGSYYYADHRDESIYRSIQMFLKQMFEKHSISVENVTCIGSSKGGTAAIIHGIPLGVGSIIAGAPQSRPGTYLGLNAPEMLEFIAGDDSEASRSWLDGLLERTVTMGATSSVVRIFVGRADHHYQDHVLPLVAALERRGIAVRTLVVHGVSHQDIGRPFSAYVGQLANYESGSLGIRESDAVIPYELSWLSELDGVALLKLWLPVGEAVAVKAFSSKGLIKSYNYSGADNYSVQIPVGEPVRFRVYRRTAATGVREAFTTRWLRP